MVGVILFRAQPFHRGHLNMVQKAYDDCVANHCDLYIFVGSADKSGTRRRADKDVKVTMISYTIIICLLDHIQMTSMKRLCSK